jgi:hypothetical protein
MAGMCRLDCAGKDCTLPYHEDIVQRPMRWVSHGDYIHAEGLLCDACGTLPQPPKPRYPTHLTCPYCPAQAMPAMARGMVGGEQVRLYVCPSKHKFYIHPEEINAKPASSDNPSDPVSRFDSTDEQG